MERVLPQKKIPFLTRLFAKAGLDLELFYVPVPRIKGDLIGVPAHLAAAIFAIVCEAISNATSSIGFGVLLAATALRGTALLPCLKQMLAETWIKLFLLWMAWMAITIAWSPDVTRGFERLVLMKFFLWTPLLWPLYKQWRWLLAAVLLSAAVLQGIQLAGACFGVTYMNETVQAGLRHPTMAGILDAIALSCWLFMAVALSWRAMLLCLPMTVLSALGFVWAGQRASLVGILVEIVVANMVLAFAVRGWLHRAFIRFVLGLVVIGSVYFVVGDSLNTKMKKVISETRQSWQDNAPQMMEDRLAMWKMSLLAWQKQPIIGVGLGGYKRATASITEVAVPYEDIHGYDTPHSTYVMILTENGIIGLSLFFVWMIAFFIRAIEYVQRDPSRIGVFGGAVIWFSAAMFDTFHMRGVFLTFGVIMMALSTMPLSRAGGVSEKEAGNSFA